MLLIIQRFYTHQNTILSFFKQESKYAYLLEALTAVVSVLKMASRNATKY